MSERVGYGLAVLVVLLVIAMALAPGLTADWVRSFK